MQIHGVRCISDKPPRHVNRGVWDHAFSCGSLYLYFVFSFLYAFGYRGSSRQIKPMFVSIYGYKIPKDYQIQTSMDGLRMYKVKG